MGDFLRFKSCALYTQLENPDQPLINVEVEAHVTRPELRTSEVYINLPERYMLIGFIFSNYFEEIFHVINAVMQVSNTFYFTFGVDQEALKNGLKIRNVAPATEEEARRILQHMDAENIS